MGDHQTIQTKINEIRHCITQKFNLDVLKVDANLRSKQQYVMLNCSIPPPILTPHMYTDQKRPSSLPARRVDLWKHRRPTAALASLE